MEAPTILTNHTGHDRSETWKKTSFLPEFKQFSSVKVIDSFCRAFHLFQLRKDYEVVVLGGGAQYDLFYLLLQRLWPIAARPVVKVDCLWYRSNPLLHFYKKALFKWLDKSVARYVVWCRREIEDYSKAFGLPRHKFTFIPYHTTNVERFEIKNNGYVFSGGNFARDYQTLVDAVRGLDLKLIIACTNKQAVEHIDMPDNVSVVSAGHREFMKLMAESGINVIALDSSLLHSGGQQTFLNAMAMGKTVIVNDPDGGKDYIEDGVDGILVPGHDPQRLRDALMVLINDPEYSSCIGARARKKAQKMDTESHLAAIAEVALSVPAPGKKSLAQAI